MGQPGQRFQSHLQQLMRAGVRNLRDKTYAAGVVLKTGIIQTLLHSGRLNIRSGSAELTLRCTYLSGVSGNRHGTPIESSDSADWKSGLRHLVRCLKRRPYTVDISISDIYS